MLKIFYLLILFILIYFHLHYERYDTNKPSKVYQKHQLLLKKDKAKTSGNTPEKKRNFKITAKHIHKPQLLYIFDTLPETQAYKKITSYKLS